MVSGRRLDAASLSASHTFTLSEGGNWQLLDSEGGPRFQLQSPLIFISNKNPPARILGTLSSHNYFAVFKILHVREALRKHSWLPGTLATREHWDWNLGVLTPSPFLLLKPHPSRNTQ